MSTPEPDPYEPADDAPPATDETGGTPVAVTTATGDQLAEAPNSTAARAAAGEVPLSPEGNTPVDPTDVDTGQRDPLAPRQQNQTGAPAGVDGGVVHKGIYVDPAVAERAEAAQRHQQENLSGSGDFVVFNQTRYPIVIDHEGHQLDAKQRRRIETLDDAVTAAAIGRGDLVNETLADD